MRRVVAALAVTVAGVLLSGCWAQQGFNAGRTSWNADETAITSANVGQLVPAWDTALPGGTDVSSPLSADGIFVISGGTRVVALDPGDGSVRWDRDLSTPGGQGVSAPLWSQRALLVPANTPGPLPSFNGSGTVYKLDVADGSTLSTGSSVTGSVANLAVRDDVVAEHRRRVAGHLGGISIAEIAWKYRPAFNWASAHGPAAGDYAIVGERVLWSQGSAAAGFSAACPPQQPGSWVDGCAPDWQADLGGSSLTRPAAVGTAQAVYGNDLGRISVVDTATGAVQWSAEAGASLAGNFVVTGRSIFVATTDQRLLAFPATGCGAATCPASWEAPLGAGAGAARLAAGGDVVYAATGAEVRAFSTGGCGAATCPPLTTLTADSAVTGGPIVDDGQVIVGTAGGHVTAWSLPAPSQRQGSGG